MALERCEHGHFFDRTMHTTCPHCGVPNLDVGRTMPNLAKFSDGEVRTMPRDQALSGRDEPGVTKGLILQQIGIDPVVGWLVCVEGPDKGLDHRIRSGNNSIGRSVQMRICIEGDEGVSRDNHAFLAFDPKASQFTLMPGTGAGIVYVDDQAIYTPAQLRPFQRIQLGSTVLVFVPLCGENFQWT